MNLSFENALNVIVQQTRVSLRAHKAFLYDTMCISNWINEGLKKNHSMFSGGFTNLQATATYLSGKEIDIPVSFNCYLIVDLSFQFYTEVKEDGLIYLHSDFKKEVVGESIIPAVYLQNHLRADLFSLLSSLPRVSCQTGSKKTYELCYHTTAYPISSHTIIATQLDAKVNTRIVFEFLACIKMPLDKFPMPPCVPVPKPLPDQQLKFWLAQPVPHFDSKFNAHSYVGRSHVWQSCNQQQRHRWRLVLRLFYMLNVGNGTLSTIGIHALKHTCINLMERFGLESKDRPLGFKLMNMLISHGALRMSEINVAQGSGQVVHFDPHPELAMDCIKTDIMLEKIRININSEKGVDLEKIQLLFGLVPSNPLKKAK